MSVTKQDDDGYVMMMMMIDDFLLFIFIFRHQANDATTTKNIPKLPLLLCYASHTHDCMKFKF